MRSTALVSWSPISGVRSWRGLDGGFPASALVHGGRRDLIGGRRRAGRLLAAVERGAELVLGFRQPLRLGDRACRGSGGCGRAICRRRARALADRGRGVLGKRDASREAEGEGQTKEEPGGFAARHQPPPRHRRGYSDAIDR